MKKIGILLMALIFLGISANAMADGVITGFTQDRHVVTRYNAFGVALDSLQRTTTVTATQKIKDGVVEGTSTETQTSVVESNWIGGSLKADTIETTTETVNSDNSTSSSHTVDDYIYNEVGNLIDVQGSGNSESYDPTTGHRTRGTVTRDYTVRSGQALLLESVSEGVEEAQTPQTGAWQQVGTFESTTEIGFGDYRYLGGSYVAMETTSTSERTESSGTTEVVTRTTEYNRNNAGVVTGMSQTAEGVRVEVTGQSGSQPSTQVYEMQDYEADIQFHPQMGWYVAGEEYTWHTDAGDDGGDSGGGGWTFGNWNFSGLNLGIGSIGSFSGLNWNFSGSGLGAYSAAVTAAQNGQSTWSFGNQSGTVGGN